MISEDDSTPDSPSILADVSVESYNPETFISEDSSNSTVSNSSLFQNHAALNNDAEMDDEDKNLRDCLQNCHHRASCHFYSTKRHNLKTDACATSNAIPSSSNDVERISPVKEVDVEVKKEKPNMRLKILEKLKELEKGSVKVEASNVIDLCGDGNDMEEPVEKAEVKEAGVKMPIGGVTVEIPVKPYPAQIQLMAKVIEGIRTKKNCLLESPTGSGKTLALLCSSLAWQRHEMARVSKLLSDRLQKQYETAQADTLDSLQRFQHSPAKKIPSTKEPYDTSGRSSPSKECTRSPQKTVFGSSTPTKTEEPSKNILDDSYDDSNEFSTKTSRYKNKRQELSPEFSKKYNDDNTELVSIHKRRKTMKNEPRDGQEEPSCSGEQCGHSCASSITAEAEEEGGTYIPKIIFGTRTHKQLSQVVKELKRTSYAAGLKMSILSGREHSCIRELQPPHTNKTTMCRELLDKKKKYALVGCNYKDNRGALTGKHAISGAWDIEELVALGSRRDSCPYFAARDLANTAHIVFCPYNYIIDPIIRSTVIESVKGDIILIDEGHNIEDMCRDAASLLVDMAELDKALTDVKILMSEDRSLSGPAPSLFFMKKYLGNWNDWFENHAPLLNRTSNSESTYKLSGQDLADSLNSHEIGVNKYNDFKCQTRSIIEEYTRNQQAKPGDPVIPCVNSTTVSLLESFIVLFDFFFRDKCQHLDDYIGLLKKEKNYANSRSAQGWIRSTSSSPVEVFTLHISCMNSALVFAEVSSLARCVILASGTLTPSHTFPGELGTDFPLNLSAPHVISPSQVWVGSVSSGPNGMALESTYKNTSLPEWQDSLGQLLLWICSNVPHGVLCFFPSYRLMEILQARWETTGLWSELNDVKSVFSESRKMREHDDIMSSFYSCVGNDLGALLFAVFRGKVSEGMDFKDHQARAVITVGIPYPNPNDAMIGSKMKYNDSHRTDRNLLSGGDWLQVQAYRALNQALGRCVRHRSDWGAVLMIDSRFYSSRNTEHVSKWVKTFLSNNHHSWESLTRGPNNLVQFMERMKITQPDTTKLI